MSPKKAPPPAPSLHLVDVSTYLFRAFYKVPPTILLPGSKRPANALYGVLNTLSRLVRERSVTRIAAVLDDVAADEDRTTLEPGYKASRREFPGELLEQVSLLPEAIAGTGIAVAHCVGWEADDVVATLAARAHAAGEAVTVVTSDKDLLQVLAPGDTFYDLARERLLPFEQANEVLGVPAPLTADFLALAGDAVDEIAGVPGIGAKTAALLVNALGTIDQIYANLAAVPKIEGLRGAAKVREKLAAHEADARKALSLTRLKTTAPLPPGLEAYTYRGTTAGSRRYLAETLGFERLSERFPKADGA